MRVTGEFWTGQRTTVRAVNGHNARARTLDSQIPAPIEAMPLPWVNTESTPPSSKIHWTDTVVAKIYPRFLYVFSDVVCYLSNELKYVRPMAFSC
jgi:hypothetical protein